MKVLQLKKIHHINTRPRTNLVDRKFLQCSRENRHRMIRVRAVRRSYLCVTLCVTVSILPCTHTKFNTQRPHNVNFYCCGPNLTHTENKNIISSNAYFIVGDSISYFYKNIFAWLRDFLWFHNAFVVLLFLFCHVCLSLSLWQSVLP